MSKENTISNKEIIKQLDKEFEKADNKEEYLLNLIKEVYDDGK